MLAVALVLGQVYVGGQAPPDSSEQKVETVSVRAKPPPRSASDWEVDHDVIASVPHETAADVLGVLPGLYVSNRGLLGQAPHLSMRGFEGTSGQDSEIFVGNIPMNQVSNVRAPGYADMRLVPPETIRSVRVSHGPYDPRQGDFAIAGSEHIDLGLEKPGFWGKGTMGSFGTRRLYLAFAPEARNDREWKDTFAAFETYGIDGPGAGRGGERSSFVGQLANGASNVQFKGILLVGSGRFDFPGYLPQEDVERGAYPYGTTAPLGRDRTTQAHVGFEVTWEIGDGVLTLGAFGSKTKMQLRQDLTGYALDALAGLPALHADDFEQVNDATTYGLDTAYRQHVTIVDARDLVEAGLYTRIDGVTQTDTRLNPDGTIFARPVDATIDATDVGAYVDLSLYPVKRLVVRGGPRLDSLSYSVTDRAANQGLDRTSQGFHLGDKVTADYLLSRRVRVVASYGEGFRSPQARLLAEGERTPFAVVQSGEVGVRVVERRAWQGSLVAFGSYLDQDHVFDALTRTYVAAPASERLGVAAALGGRWGAFGTNVSATYARAAFTAGDATFRAGALVPYAPRFVLRDDAFVVARIGTLADSRVRARFGVGLQGAAGASLPDGRDARDVLYVDALASVAWRGLELAANGMNLLNQRYYDAQFVYPSNAKGGPLPVAAPHVLVAPPAGVFVTLQVHIRDAPKSGEAPDDDDDDARERRRRPE